MQNYLPIEKRRPWQIVLSLLLVCVLLLGGMAAGLFAIIAGASDTVINLGAEKAASARQAQQGGISPFFEIKDGQDNLWGEETEIEIFKVSYENGEQKVTVAGKNNQKVIAPGTENLYTFLIRNTSGGTLDYKLVVEAVVTGLDGTDKVLPLQARLKGLNWLVGEEDEFKPVLDLNGAEESAVLGFRESTEYQLQWRWPFEQDHDGDGSIADGDALDTWLGTQEEPISLTIRLTVLYSYHFPPIPAVSAPIPGILNGTDHFAYLFGYPDGTIRPEAEITRAEFAAVLYRLLRDEVREQYETNDCDYPDVSPDAWYRNEVATMTNLGILVGYPDGTFRGDQTISRGEVAVVLAKLHDLQTNAKKTEFSDIDGHWAKEHILIIEDNNWVSGYPDGTFRPDDPITRAETASVMNRVLHRLPEEQKDLHVEGMVTWPDNQDTEQWYYLAIQEATNGHYYARLMGTRETWTKLRETPDWMD